MWNKSLLSVCALLVLTNCAYSEPQKRADKGDLTRELNLVDKNGRNYGTIEMTPLGGGRVYDADGRLIGEVVDPKSARDSRYYSESRY